MKLPEFERRITDAAEALQLCARSIKGNDAFAVEDFLKQAQDDLTGCLTFANDWADEQEEEIGKAEESKGYEVVE